MNVIGTYIVIAIEDAVTQKFLPVVAMRQNARYYNEVAKTYILSF